MKKHPEIRIYWENSPGKKAGILIERVFAGSVYERKVSPDGLLSATEAASALGVTLRHLYNLVEDRKLKPMRKAGRLFFRLSEVKQQFSRPRSRRREPWLVG